MKILEDVQTSLPLIFTLVTPQNPYTTKKQTTSNDQLQMSVPMKPISTFTQNNPHLPTRRSNHVPIQKQRRTRRQYALHKFDFEDDSLPPETIDMLAAYGLTGPSVDRDGGSSETADLQKCTERHYGPQIPTPTTPVSPCINATDRARRARRSRVRQAGDIGPDFEVFCDVTSLLGDRGSKDKDKSVARSKKRGELAHDDVRAEHDGYREDDDVPEMLLSDDEMKKDYEVVGNEVLGSEHNGTVRRWYRGLRHRSSWRMEREGV
jgi:hypothetical protein